jgi:hypothetical protein
MIAHAPGTRRLVNQSTAAAENPLHTGRAWLARLSLKPDLAGEIDRLVALHQDQVVSGIQSFHRQR